MNVLDLFSGIGGFSLGLERAGMRTVAFCEIEPFARAVLAKHWPDVPCYDDVRTLSADRLRSDGISVDVICGGFPCQDISRAGKGAGITGARSGLWAEYARLICELRPRYVIVENVSALLSRGLDRVLGDLAAIGYDAEWHCIRAADVGAPHLRDRIWIVAYPQYTDADRQRPHRTPLHEHGSTELRDEQERVAGSVRPHVSDAICRFLWLEPGRRDGKSGAGSPQPRDHGAEEPLADAVCLRKLQQEGSEPDQRGRPSDRGWWRTEPDVGRVADGIPARVDRLKGLGNAVVPQIPEIIGRAIMTRYAVTSPHGGSL
jgi:DNA (cytosine-5)-methyltransferase 1